VAAGEGEKASIGEDRRSCGRQERGIHGGWWQRRRKWGGTASEEDATGVWRRCRREASELGWIRWEEG
jgi:hypothetical protein